MLKLGLLAVLIAILSGCETLPQGDVLGIKKQMTITVAHGTAVYSLAEYCSKFPYDYRLGLRNSINQQGVYTVRIDCPGDPK